MKRLVNSKARLKKENKKEQGPLRVAPFIQPQPRVQRCRQFLLLHMKIHERFPRFSWQIYADLRSPVVRAPGQMNWRYQTWLLTSSIEKWCSFLSLTRGRISKRSMAELIEILAKSRPVRSLIYQLLLKFSSHLVGELPEAIIDDNIKKSFNMRYSPTMFL